MDQHLSVEARRPRSSSHLTVYGSSAGLGWQGLFSSFENVPATAGTVCPPIMGEEMIVVHRSAGTIRWRENDRWTYEHANPGSIHLIPSGTAHSIALDQSVQAQSVLLGREILIEVASEFVRGDPEKITLHHLLYAPPPDQSLLLDSIGAAFMGRKEGSAILAEYAARTIAAQLLVAWSVEQGRTIAFPPKRGRSRVVARAMDYMHANLSAKLTLAIIADAAGVSITVLGREFRKDLGIAPHNALIDLRLKRAQNLLQRSRFSLPDIAVQCGFSSQEHMTHTFRDRLGLTPGAYRKMIVG